MVATCENRCVVHDKNREEPWVCKGPGQVHKGRLAIVNVRGPGFPQEVKPCYVRGVPVYCTVVWSAKGK